MSDTAPPADSARSLADLIFAAATRFLDRPALEIDVRVYSYQQLASFGAAIASRISQTADGVPLAGVLASRSLSAYAAIWGILGAGRGYVPLNPAFPAVRNRSIVEQSEIRTIVVGREAAAGLEEFLEGLPPLILIFPEMDRCEVDALPNLTGHTTFASEDLDHDAGVRGPVAMDPEDWAYLIFTSGSTGVPKGVPITNRNVTSYVQHVAGHYSVDENDRFSQGADLTFDFSIHDLFVCWSRGASLCVVPKDSLMAPARFIASKQLTMWASVPSVGGFLKKMRLLRPGSFPTLRHSIFCGEPLSAAVAEAWAAASPNGTVENIYGPTEATVAITGYRWDPDRSPAESRHGIVPIGWPFPGQKAAIVSPDGEPVEKGQTGELLLSGSQVTSGYIGEAASMNQERFVGIPSLGGGHWYRTGDLARELQNGCLEFVGRVDNQVKVRGYRVELQEVEHALRKLTGAEAVVAIGWPVHDGVADGLIGIVQGPMQDSVQLRRRCDELLPSYMVPTRIHFVDALPLSANAKFDRKALHEMLDRGLLS